MAVLQSEGQIDRRKKIIRNAAIIFITIIVLLTFFSKTINNFLLPEVECGSARPGTLTTEVLSRGEVVPINTETINSYGNWKVNDIKVEEGTTVKKGDVLAVIDSSDIMLDIKRLELNLLKMENNLKLYKNQLQDKDLDQYIDDVEVAQKAVKKAEKKLEDQKALYAYDAVALESVNDAQEQLDNAKRDYEQKQKLLSKKEEESKKSGDDYQITLREKESEIQVCRLELENKKKNTPTNGVIKAPVDGIVKSIFVKAGATTNGGQELFEIVKNEAGMHVKWNLTSKESSLVDGKYSIKFTVTEPEEIEFSGFIKEKKYLSDEGTYEYIAEIKDVNETINIGQKVEVLIQKSNGPYQTIVPNSSVIKEGGKDCVYVLKTKDGIMGEENYVQKLEVTVDDSDDFNSAISGGGLSEEDRIVVFSSKPLSDKIQVKLG